MKEENNGTPKNKWSRIFRKKWFFPAVYLTIAALLLSVVVWYQNLDNQIQETEDDQSSESYTPAEHDEDAQSVMDQQEVIKMPVVNQDQAEIVTNFYDYNAEQEEQENALVMFNNRFYQSTGIDIASADGETFDVLASLSGTVTEVREDPLLGNVVALSHENDVVTYYASLQGVNVKSGDKVQQGDVLGNAGENMFGQESGTHVHFEIRKDGKEVNPESFFNQPLSALDEASTEDEGTESEATEEESVESDGTQESTEESGTGAEDASSQNSQNSNVEGENSTDDTSDSSSSEDDA
ncbi:M23 family metallopeptidase [Virgibacillus litoralis]|uniref:Stage II sporulation protein Q n=1 Tax=Virgibacillus litoralis TaxID=578221 RepID=A0ABS4HD37_9BACI|nr:M23 family metallopeptidase [Virgibacillus litoralis]MBP1948836.1 stage II sporulation protein Q [Virgibacillus litoralis]